MELILMLFIMNIIIMHSFAILARKTYIKRFRECKKPNVLNQSTSSPVSTYYKLLKRYLSGLVQYEVYIVGFIPSQRLRQLIFKHVFLMKIGKNVTIYGGADIRHPWNIKIEDNCAIGNNVILDGRNGIILKKNTNLSQGVWIWTAQHDINDINFACKTDIRKSRVIINELCWCGPRTVILPGRSMAKGSVLGASGVLTKNTEEFGIYGGVPAKKIGERNHKINYNLDGNYLPFF